LHSRDLVHWRQIGNVLDRPGQLDLPAGTRPSGGIYVPTIRHHDGRFHAITTNVDGGGTFLVSSERPEGPWSDPVWIDLAGIDPDLAWDDDGSCWCALAGVAVARIDTTTGKVLEGPLPAWSGTGMQDPEAPHLYRIGDWWYLLPAEGGTAHGHSVSIARARSPRGLWESAPGNPVLTHRSTGLPIHRTGHADLVQAPEGTWWMLLLGTRPRGCFPSFHVLGRETFLAPVEWVDGWPTAGPVRESHPAPTARHPVEPEPPREDFDAAHLAPYWISPRSRPDGSWSLGERPGWLTLHATGSSRDLPGRTFVGRRQQHPDCRVSARLAPGTGRGGLSVRMDEAHHYDLEVAGGEVSVIARIGPVRQELARRPLPSGPVTLVVDIRTADLGPDTIAFSTEGGEPLAELDGRHLSTQVATGFTGRVIGMYVTEGTAAFDWFEYLPATGA
jgi:xylan 1,4-beta-xylosidase